MRPTGLQARLLVLPAALVAFVATVGVTYFASNPESAVAASAPVASSGSNQPSVTVPSSPAILAEGQRLFIENCSSCHGSNAAGTVRAPNLVGLGPAWVDFWVSTGRMPLAYLTAQAVPKPPIFNTSQRLAVVAWVASLAPGGNQIPLVSLKGANVAVGNDLFSLNCAGCHTITGAGDALADGYVAPSIFAATSTQIAEAMRTGPGNMPRFGPNQLSTQQMDDVVAYVRDYIQHPSDPGGLGLGHVGPVAEGFVGLALGVGVLMVFCYWIGDRVEHDEDDEHHAEGHTT